MPAALSAHAVLVDHHDQLLAALRVLLPVRHWEGAVVTPEQTRRQHVAQRDMVVRSLLLAPTPEERGEERPRKPRQVTVVPVVSREPGAHAYRLPIVREARYL